MEIEKAVIVMVAGMGVVFASLGLLTLIMILLDKVVAPSKLPAAIVQATDQESATVAAIAVALALSRKGKPARVLCVPPGRRPSSIWAASGRRDLMRPLNAGRRGWR